jgi:hypothetical protein
MNQLIVRGWTPHVIAYVGSFSCSTEVAMKKLPARFAAKIKADLPNTTAIKEKLKHAYGQQYVDYQKELRKAAEFDSSAIEFLITERVKKAITLADWLNTPHPVEDYKSVMFQLLYTYEVFNRIGFRHNDAHGNNIFLEDHKNKNLVHEYIIDGVTYKVPIRFMVKIFDFDRSSFNCDPSKVDPKFKELIEMYKSFLKQAGLLEDCKNNSLDGGLCRQLGECNTINTKYDTFMTFIIIGYMLEKKLPNFKNQNYDIDLINSTIKTLNFTHKHLSNATKHTNHIKYLVNKGYLGGDYYPTDSEMSTTLTMLQDPFFQSFAQPVLDGDEGVFKMQQLLEALPKEKMFPVYMMP